MWMVYYNENQLTTQGLTKTALLLNHPKKKKHATQLVHHLHKSKTRKQSIGKINKERD